MGLAALALLSVCAGFSRRKTREVEARQAVELRIEVDEEDIDARRFYERHGFVVVGGTDGDNEEGAPDLRLEWQP